MPITGDEGSLSLPDHEGSNLASNTGFTRCLQEGGGPGVMPSNCEFCVPNARRMLPWLAQAQREPM